MKQILHLYVLPLFLLILDHFQLLFPIYKTYKGYYELEKAIENDPRLKGTKAKRKVARFVSLKTIPQKAAVIVPIFLHDLFHQPIVKAPLDNLLLWSSPSQYQ